jgi:hypothetical protein
MSILSHIAIGGHIEILVISMREHGFTESMRGLRDM